MARVAITGVAGFIGSHVAEAALSRGFFVRGLDVIARAPAGVERVVGDVGEAAAAARLCSGADFVVHTSRSSVRAGARNCSGGSTWKARGWWRGRPAKPASVDSFTSPARWCTAALAGRRGVLSLPTPLLRMRPYAYSIEKARRDLGYEPSVGLDEGLRRLKISMN